MNIHYDIADSCRRNVFYDPIQCKKSYNCLILKDFNPEVEIEQLFKLKHKTDSSLVYDKTISRVDDGKIFFGPSVDDISDIHSYVVEIDNTTYDLSDVDNQITVGSIIIPSVGSMMMFYEQNLFRLISDDSNISNILNFESTFVGTNKQYTFPNPAIEIGYGDNDEVQNFINANDNILIQPVSKLKHPLNLKLWINIDSGNPFVIDGVKQYKMILTDLVYNIVKEKNILKSHLESGLQKRKYSLKIIDQDNTAIKTVNGLEFLEEDLILDLTKPQHIEDFEDPKTIEPKIPVLSQALKNM